MAELTRSGDGIKTPYHPAVLGIVGGDLPPNAEFASGNSGDDQAVIVEGGAGDRVTLLPFLNLSGPERFSRPLIQGDQTAIQLAHIDLAVSQGHSPTGPYAADRVDFRIEMSLILP